MARRLEFSDLRQIAHGFSAPDRRQREPRPVAYGINVYGQREVLVGNPGQKSQELQAEVEGISLAKVSAMMLLYPGKPGENSVHANNPGHMEFDISEEIGHTDWRRGYRSDLLREINQRRFGNGEIINVVDWTPKPIV